MVLHVYIYIFQYGLIILGSQLEISLRMSTYRTDFRRFFSKMDMSAV